jgi:hypothetical protein
MAEFCTLNGSNAVTVTIKKVTKYAARFGGTSIARGDLETEKLNGR